MLVVIAVALAGCATTQTTTKSGDFGQTTPAAGAASSGSPSSGAASSSSSGPVSGSQLFGAAYNWVEYKISGGLGDQQMTIYQKWTKDGKCTMRFEGAGASEMPAGMQTIDCTPKGGQSNGQSASNPNDVSSDVKLVKVGTETVTVGAGTFVADKYTMTSNGNTATYWITSGKPVLKMSGGSSEGTFSMELNSIG
jgi:hypothetical protein